MEYLTAKDDSGRFLRRKLIFPVFKPSPVKNGPGHWYYVCLKPQARRLEVGDSLSGDNTIATKVIARLWDDICVWAQGFHHGAHAWPVVSVDIGKQAGNWECGFYAAAGISGECANSRGRLMQEEVGIVKQLMALDLCEGTIFDNGARVRKRQRAHLGGMISGRQPVGSPTNVHTHVAQAGQRPHLPPGASSDRQSSPTSHSATPPLEQLPSPSPSDTSGDAQGDSQRLDRSPSGTPDGGVCLNRARRSQWDSTGIRTRKTDSKVWRKRRKAQEKALGMTENLIDCPEPEHVLQTAQKVWQCRC